MHMSEIVFPLFVKSYFQNDFELYVSTLRGHNVPMQLFRNMLKQPWCFAVHKQCLLCDMQAYATYKTILQRVFMLKY